MTASKTQKQKIEPRELQRQAALAGPGYLGRRSSLDMSGRNDLARKMLDAKLTVPGYLDGGIAWKDRRAKLFQVGDYPDKGVCVRREDLTALVENFDLPVPILIEHSESPLEIGYLTAVAVEGDELFGTLALSEEAETLIDLNRAFALSIGLKRDLSQIREVSLVRNPRVPDARIFNEMVHFMATWELARGLKEDFSDRIEHFLREGKMTIAQSEIVQEIFEKASAPVFREGTSDLAALFTQFLERQPRFRVTMETAPTPHRDHSEHLLLPEEVDFYQRHFPGVSLDEISRSKRAQ